MALLDTFLAVRSNGLLCRHSNLVVKELWSKVGTVRPSYRMKVWMELKRSEYTELVQRFEDRALKLVAQVHLAFNSIVETDP